MYRKQLKPKFKDTILMVVTNLKLNLKAAVKGDRGSFKKHSTNASEVSYCKEYKLD